MLKHGRQLYKMPEILDILIERMADLYREAMGYIKGMLAYACEMLDEEAATIFIERFRQKLKPKEQEKFMVSFAEHYRQEGRLKGKLETTIALTILQITGLSMAEIEEAIKEKSA